MVKDREKQIGEVQKTEKDQKKGRNRMSWIESPWKTKPKITGKCWYKETVSGKMVEVRPKKDEDGSNQK